MIIYIWLYDRKWPVVLGANLVDVRIREDLRVKEILGAESFSFIFDELLLGGKTSKK